MYVAGTISKELSGFPESLKGLKLSKGSYVRGWEIHATIFFRTMVPKFC